MTGGSEFLSVVIPTRNRAQLLHECIAGLIEQDYPTEGYEVIVVDDGTGDMTRDLVSQMAAARKETVLRYVRCGGRGLNVARNMGIEAARGRTIALIDDDVLVPRTWLRALVEGIRRHPDADCFGGPVRLRLEGRAPRVCSGERLGESDLDLGDVERPVRLVIGANMAFRRSAIEKAGLFDERLSGSDDENEWELRLSGVGGQIVYLPEAWLWHRRTARDLRLWRLVLSRFRRGRQVATYAKLAGVRMSVLRELRPIPRSLAHALRYRCAAGLLAATGQVGRVWGTFRERGA